MDIPIIALCDSAVDYSGKLVVVGTFDTIAPETVPFILDQCCVALRLIIRQGHEKKDKHSLRIEIADDEDNFIIQPLDATFEINLGNAPFAASNLVFTLRQIPFARAGLHELHVSLDGRRRANIPLLVQVRKDLLPHQNQAGSSKREK